MPEEVGQDTPQAPLLVLIDYEAGNLRSITKALEGAGARVALVRDPARAPVHDGIVLPGVGAFGAAMQRLTEVGFPKWIRQRVEAGVPLLGICLGIQLLFARSEEAGDAPGLGLLPGDVRRLSASLTVPHMGWNQLEMTRPVPVLKGVADGAFVYFVHSYIVYPSDENDIVATTTYGDAWASIVQRDRVLGLQFHPEKSGPVGQRILRNFVTTMVGFPPKAPNALASAWKSSPPST